jgi:hypothetical protein
MRPTPAQLALAAICLLVAVAAAYAGASATQTQDLFSLTPPPSKGAPAGTVVAPDTTSRLVLHRTAFTAWAALVLAAPALCAFLFRRTSGWWLAFWTVGFAGFAVHVYWAVFMFFGGDWNRMMHSTRVSVPITDTLFTLWWGVDVLLAWMTVGEGKLIAVERWLVHLMAFILFFAGAALQGDLALSRALGWGLLTAVAISVVAHAVAHRRVPAPV